MSVGRVARNPLMVVFPRLHITGKTFIVSNASHVSFMFELPIMVLQPAPLVENDVHYHRVPMHSERAYQGSFMSCVEYNLRPNDLVKIETKIRASFRFH